MNYFNYFSEIEETFVRRRGRNLLLSPLDWALIETWQERGVPLHVILRGIETVFDSLEMQQNSARKRTVKSLFYCKEEIEAQYTEWLERQVGKNGSSEKEKTPQEKKEESPVIDETIKIHLENVSGELRLAAQKADGDLREVLKNVLKRLDELKRNSCDAENLENDLEDLEKLIDAHLLKTNENKELEKEIENQIKSYKNKMERETYQRTFELMLLKKLREEREIPRLSLFYL